MSAITQQRAVPHSAPSTGPDSVATAFARYLRAVGVERVYGVPGEDHMRLLDALAAEGVRYVPAREESAACMMAAAEAQARRVPGVAIVTLAPGLTNAVNGMANALLDNLPLMLVCGQHGPDRHPLIVRQGLDNHAIVHGVTKWSVTASPLIHQVLAKALDVATSPPAGPVLLELREDVARAVVRDRAEDWPLLNRAPGHGGAGEEARALGRRLAAAVRPAVLVGPGPYTAAERDVLERLTTALRAPLFASPAAKGVVATSHPWLAGNFLNGNLEEEILGRCDLLLAVNLTARDFFNRAWPYAAPVLALQSEHAPQRFLPAQREIVGDVAALLDAALAAVSVPRSEWEAGDVAAYRERLVALFEEPRGALTIPAALLEARRLAPEGAVVAVDAGFGKPLASYLWTSSVPNGYYSSHGLSTMGYAIPAANALALALPDRPVLAFMGDGSLLMRATEIGVAVDQGVAPVYVAWMDASLSQIEVKQRRLGLREVGVGFSLPNCRLLAESLGAQGFDVATLPEFTAALQAGLASRVPTLIGARIDQSSRERWFDLIRG